MTRLHVCARLKKRADHICQRCGFAAMLVCVIIISLVMVAVALEMYNTSGAAQVDLSRPGFSSVQKQAGASEETEKGFSAQGEIDQKTIKDFKNVYDKHAKRAAASTSFGGEALSDSSIQVFNERSSGTAPSGEASN